MVIIFFSIVAVVLTLVHFVILHTFTTIFALSGFNRLMTGVILFGLGASFIITSMLNANNDHWLLRLYYHISAIWVGFMTYFFIASCLFAVILLIAKLFTGPGVTSATHAMGFLLIFTAILFGIYGLWNARDIVIRNINVSIPDLPASWQERKVLLFADSHFGAIHNARKARIMVDKIKKINPDIILIPGDFFDGSKLDYNNFVSIFSELKPALGIYFVTGNHEEFTDNPAFINALESVNIKVLKNEAVMVDGINIVGVGDRDSISPEKFQTILSGLKLAQGTPAILIKHQPRQLDIALENNIDLQLTGHTHRAQMFPLNIITKYMYQGYDYGLKDYGKMKVLTTSGVGTWGPPMRVGSKNEMWVIGLR